MDAHRLTFEYGVILNGSQTYFVIYAFTRRFEYGVILNGSQTGLAANVGAMPFEYGVILNGSQTWTLTLRRTT